MSQIGLIGLAVMGQNLALNLLEKGYTVSVYNRTQSKTKLMVETAEKQQLMKNLTATYDVRQFVESLEQPRIIILMVQAGQPVDSTIDSFINFCNQDDIIMDGGNSNFTDTIKRCSSLYKLCYYVGSGISGGEEGARFGPCIMPGGDERAKSRIMPILEKISAKSEDRGDNCTTWIGPGGSGHFVKMVHNGIEYADMQIISEAYWFMKQILNLNNDEQSKVFEQWNMSELSSYLIKITSDILKKKNDNNQSVIDTISDKAGQKGTGKWTVVSSLDSSMPVQAITEAVYVRMLSNMTKMRNSMEKEFPDTVNLTAFNSSDQKEKYLGYLKDSILASKIIAYAQGFSLIKKASDANSWNIDIMAVSKIFEGGCIIRSQFLDHISEVYNSNPEIESILLDNGYFKRLITQAVDSWRELLKTAISSGLPMPVVSSCLQYFDTIRSEKLPSNLIQAQRDYFGAHGYETVDNEGTFVHTEWSEYSGNATSGFYQK